MEPVLAFALRLPPPGSGLQRDALMRGPQRQFGGVVEVLPSLADLHLAASVVRDAPALAWVTRGDGDPGGIAARRRFQAVRGGPACLVFGSGAADAAAIGPALDLLRRGWDGWPAVHRLPDKILYPSILRSHDVPHSPAEKKRVLARVGRIRGQIDGLQRALDQGAECAAVLQQIAALRGAVNGLMAQVLESHLREELGQPATTARQRQERVDEVVALVRSYLK